MGFKTGQDDFVVVGGACCGLHGVGCCGYFVIVNLEVVVFVVELRFKVVRMVTVVVGVMVVVVWTLRQSVVVAGVGDWGLVSLPYWLGF